MKQIITLFLLLPTIVYGQNTDHENSSNIIHNEIGFSLYSLTGLKNASYDCFFETPNAPNSFFSGIYYKHFWKKNGIRTSFDFYDKSVHNDFGTNSGQYYEWSIGSLKAGEVQIGYERIFGNKKLLPFVFIDLSYNYSQCKGYKSWQLDLEPGEIDHPFLIEKSMLGSAVGIGLKYHPIKFIVISIESSIQFIYYIVQDLKSLYSYKFSGISYSINPVRNLSIGFTF